MLDHLLRWPVLLGMVWAAASPTALCSAQENGLGNMPMGPAAPVSPDLRSPTAIGRPPIQPQPVTRPSAWPGSEPEASPWTPPDQRSTALGSTAAASVPAGDLKLCDGTRILARVGSDAIFESEANGAVNEILEANKARIPASQIESQRELLIRQRLKSLIETKLIYQDARRTIPDEGWKQVEKQLTKQFEEMELNNMVARAHVASPRELDQKFRTLGTSLEREKRAFIERTLAQQWVHQQIKKEDEITYDQMVNYYRQHQDQFTKAARARWEELMVRYAKHPNKAAAWEAIAAMGNRVAAGAPFADVARAGSDGTEAAAGGQRGWTTKDALLCKELDEALFSQPLGSLGPIIEGPTGFHIVRVAERQNAAVTPFLEAQVDIRERIIKQRSEKQFREYMAKLEERTPIWIYDSSGRGELLSSRPAEAIRR